MSNDSNNIMEDKRASLGQDTAKPPLSEEPRVQVERIGDSGSPPERSAGSSRIAGLGGEGGGENDGDEKKDKEQETREKKSGQSTENADRQSGEHRGNMEVHTQGDQPAPFSTLEEAVIRHLTFWRNGFQIGGTIRQYDDPASKYILETINAGTAPASVWNVLPGQLLELRVENRLTEDYISPHSEVVKEDSSPSENSNMGSSNVNIN